MDETKPFGIIYKITSPSGKVYIGQTIQTLASRTGAYRRLECKKQVKIYQAILKYGWDNMVCEWLESCSSKDELDRREIFFIKEYDSIKNGYNCLKGGAGFSMPQSFRDRMTGSDNPMSAKNRTEEQRKALADKNRGKKRSREFCEKMKEYCKKSQESRRNNKYKHSEETKEKLKKVSHKYWKDEKLREIGISKISECNKKLDKFEFYNIKTGEIFIADRHQFSKEKSIKIRNCYALVSEYIKQTSNWILLKNKGKPLRQKRRLQKPREAVDKTIRTFFNEKTKVIFVGTQHAFRKKFDFDQGGVSALSLKKIQKYKNWILLDSSPEKQ